MINDIAKDIIKLCNVNKFVETGIHHGETLGTVIGWFSELYDDFRKKDVPGKYTIFDVDLVKEYYDKAKENYAQHNKNVSIANESSENFLKRLINEGAFTEEDNCMFYLDAHWYSYWPLRNEIEEILKLKKAIILIDDFHTPGRSFGYDTYHGTRLGLNYIKDLIQNKTNYIYYAAIANRDNRGMGIIFLGYDDNALEVALRCLPLIKENLTDKSVSLLGKYSRILLLETEPRGVHSDIFTQFYGNYLDGCFSSCEVITFGYNKGANIYLRANENFNTVIQALPINWIPDVCIVPNSPFNLIPSGIEQSPFPTVYIAYDWDCQVYTARTFAESVDVSLAFGEFAQKSLQNLGANNINVFYPHGTIKGTFSLTPKKIQDREYDILYTALIDDVNHRDRSEWILRLCQFAEKHKYKVQIVPYTTFLNYMELTQNSKLVFSHQRFGEMTPRIYEAASQGTVTIDTGSETRKYFVPHEEYIPVTEEDFEEQIKKYLENKDLLQTMSNKVYKKALDSFDTGFFLKDLLDKARSSSNKVSSRILNSMPQSEKHIRMGEMYYYSFFHAIRNNNLSIDKYVDLLGKSIFEFKKAIDLEPTPRGMLNMAVAEASLYLWIYKTYKMNSNFKKILSTFETLISSYPFYAMTYYYLGLINFQFDRSKEALDMFTKALGVFDDPKYQIDPWCIYLPNFDFDPKKTFAFEKPLNSILCMDNKNEANTHIKILYQAMTLYYLSILYEMTGQIHNSVKALVESHNLYPHSSAVALQAARKLAVLGFKDESIQMYKKAVELFPLDVDLRIEYIKTLYVYQIDREIPTEIKNVFTLSKTITTYKDKITLLNDIMKNLTRFQSVPNYSHDFYKETILDQWLETLHNYLKLEPKNLKLVIRMIDIWRETGRTDKIVEILEDYVHKHLAIENIDNTMRLTIIDIYRYLQTTSESQTKAFQEKLYRLKSFLTIIGIPIN